MEVVIGNTCVLIIARLSTLLLELVFSFVSEDSVDLDDWSSQLFLVALIEPTKASETFEIPATTVTIFFFESPCAGDTFKPPDNLLPGDMELLRPAGDAAPFRPTGDGWRNLDGTMMAGSFATLLFSSLAATKLGTSHLDGTGDEDLEPTLPSAGEDGLEFAFAALGAGEGLRCSASAPLFLVDLAAAGDEKRRLEAAVPETGGMSVTFSLAAKTVLVAGFSSNGAGAGGAESGAGWMRKPSGREGSERARSGSGRPAKGRGRPGGMIRTPDALGTGCAGWSRATWTSWPSWEREERIASASGSERET